MFHAARELGKSEPSLEGTKWMVDRYPQDIRAWIERRGGPEKMTIEEFWTLTAEELWFMGYRHCTISPSEEAYTQHLEREEQEKWDERTRKAEQAWQEWQRNKE